RRTSGCLAGRDGVSGAAGGSAAQVGRNPLADVDHGVEIDAGLDAHAVQHVDDVFGGDVAGGAFGVGAAAQPGHGGVEDGDAGLQRGEYVGEGLTVGVVEV